MVAAAWEPSSRAAPRYRGEVVDYIGRALVADALAEWRSQLQDLATASPLRDLSFSTAPTFDLAGAHPSGLAQLFAGRPTLMSSLVRDAIAQPAALHRGRLMRDHAEAIRLNTGVATAALIVGTARWREGARMREMPLLLRPVTLGLARDTDTEITLHDTVKINPVFVAELRERGVDESLDGLAQTSMQGKEFDPRPLWTRVREMTTQFGDELVVDETLILGSFDDPEQRLVDDLDECDHLISSSLLLASVAGDSGAHDELAVPVPIVGAGDRDPFAERGLGDLDDAQFAALDLVATGRSVFIQVPPGGDATGTAAAIAADGAASGRSVAVVCGANASVRSVEAALEAVGAGELVVSAAAHGWNSAARASLLSSMTASGSSVNEEALRAQGEALLSARSELRERMEDLHLRWEPWGVSAYQAVQALVRLTSSEFAPGTHVRLTGETAATVAERGLMVVAEAGVRAYAARVGPASEGTENPVSEPETEGEEPARRWWEGTILDAQRGAMMDDKLAIFLLRHVPHMRESAREAAAEIGVDEARTLAAWGDQVELFDRLRQTLDTFQPRVFTHHHGDVVEATAAAGSALFGDMPKRERKAIARQAKDLLRPNRSDDHLHERLVEARHLHARWKGHSSAGAVPRVPDDLDAFAARFGEAAVLWADLAPAVEAVTGIARLADQPWDVLVATLSGLSDADEAPLAEAEVRETEEGLEAAGFGPLLDDMEARAVPLRAASAEFEFAWWAAAFDSIVAAAPKLAQTGAIGFAVREFLGRDRQFGAERVKPLMRAVGERRRAAIARHQDDARDLFAALVEGGDGPFSALWGRFPQLVGALRPIVIASAEQVSQIAPAARVIDTVVLMGIESLAFAEVVPALARSSQVVVLADAHSATKSAVTQLRETLPPLALHARPQPRDPRVTAVLDEHGYAGELEMYPAPSDGVFEVVHVDAIGAPDEGSTYVESTRAEVAAVVERISRSATSMSAGGAAVVAGNELHALRIRDALEERRSAGGASIPVVTLGSAAGLDAGLVVFAPGWAPDAAGVVSPTLGILSGAVGARALRQTLVASNRDLAVTTALTPEHVSSLRANADLGHGLEVLADLLAVAEAGPLVPVSSEQGNWVLADIAGRLRARGLHVAVRYGVGGAVIPLVVGAAGADTFSVAVVTDDAPPAAGVSLRDMVRWQQSRLEGLGWTVIPMWTVDAFADPQAAAREILIEFGIDAALPAAQPPPPTDLAPTELPPAEFPPPSAEQGVQGAAPTVTSLVEAEPVLFDGKAAAPPLAEEAVLELSVAPTEAVAAETGSPSPVEAEVPPEDEREQQTDVGGESDGEPGSAPNPSDGTGVDSTSDGENAESEADEPDEPDDVVAPSWPTEEIPLHDPTASPSTPRAGSRRAGRKRMREAVEPVLPSRSKDDTDEGWGEQSEEASRDDEIKRDVPPHH